MSVILATAGYDHTIRFWEALSGMCNRTIQHPTSQVNRLCISPDKRYLAAAGRHSVKLYEIQSTNDLQPTYTIQGHTGNITAVCFHCEGKWMVTSSEDTSVRVWDPRSGAGQRTYHHDFPVNDVVIHPNQGEIISCDAGGFIRIWDLCSNKCSYLLNPEPDVAVSSVSINHDGSLMCASTNSPAHFLSIPPPMLPTSLPLSTFTKNQGTVYVWHLEQNPDNTIFLSDCIKFSAHSGYILRILFSPDGRKLATCSSDHTTKIWAVPDIPSRPPTPVNPHPGHWPGLEQGLQGLQLEQLQQIQQVHQMQQLQQMQYLQQMQQTQPPHQTQQVPPQEGGGESQPSTDNKQLPSNKLMSSGVNERSQDRSQDNNENLANENISTDPELPGPDPVPAGFGRRIPPFIFERALGHHQRWVWDCAFSADSAYLVTACSDHYARLWELSTGMLIRQYSGHHRGVVCVALNDYSG